MSEIFNDRLYGKIYLSPADVKLLQQPRVARARKVSLSAVPSHLTDFSAQADRGEHGIGTAYLTSRLSSEFECFRKLLYRAGFLHDTGHPPFSHTSDPYMAQITSRNHESMVEDVLQEEQIRRIILDEGLLPDNVLQVIKGEFPLIGKLINGSIDLDNLDNSLRYGLSGGVTRSIPYSPGELAHAFRIVNGVLVLHSHCRYELKNWKTLREEVYEMVYDDANLRGGMMLQRALDLAYQEDQIKPEFFLLTDDEALAFLRSHTNPRSQKLIENATLHRMYKNILEYHSNALPESPTAINYYTHWRGRQMLADEITKELGIDPMDMCVYVGVSKGAKSITLPFWNDDEGFLPQPFEEAKKVYIAKLFLNPSKDHKAKEVAARVAEMCNFDTQKLKINL